MSNLWNATVQAPTPVAIALYVILWVVFAICLYYVFTRGKAAGFSLRWTTQDFLVLAIMGVLLEVYDNLIGDQFVTPIISLLPFGHLLALNDLPYMFLLMVGIALIRKPGVATGLVFVNFLLMQVLYPGDKSSVLWWQYGVYQGILVDVYIAARGPKLFTKANWTSVFDGLIMGALRAVPATDIQPALLSPLFTGETKTVGAIVVYSVLNLIGNGVEAAISSPLAIRIAQSVTQTSTREPAPASAQPAVAGPSHQDVQSER